MNKIVLEHYPASKLPVELRGTIAPNASVKVTVEEEARKPLPLNQLHRQLQNYRSSLGRKVTIEEAVARVRELRDEWDD